MQEGVRDPMGGHEGSWVLDRGGTLFPSAFSGRKFELLLRTAVLKIRVSFPFFHLPIALVSYRIINKLVHP